MTTMKALVLEEYNKLVYKGMPVPGIKAKEILVEVQACAICGSDVRCLDNKASTAEKYPKS